VAAWKPNISRLQGRDEAEWCLVEENFGGRLLAYAQRRTAGDVQAAEDVLQETLLGAVRGIDNFNSAYTFEQYMFGIVRNRTIDFMRRRKLRTLMGDNENDDFPDLDAFIHDDDTPSAIVRGIELSERAQDLLGEILKEWVLETWAAGEFQRLTVLESLFAGGWRNRDVWREFGLRDETAVAGIKFRAIKRLQHLVSRRESGGDLLAFLAKAEDGGGRLLDLDVTAIWVDYKVGCMGREVLGQLLAGKLEATAEQFLGFHLNDVKCDSCRANLDDLAADMVVVDTLLTRLTR
jgi:RNA polymerase sigma factor (sigma-70 family)